MERFKPLLAIFGLALVGLAVIALFKYLPGDSGRTGNSGNAPSNTPGNSAQPPEVEVTTLEDLPIRDPAGLWPRDGVALSAPSLWLMWETPQRSECRVLRRKSESRWQVAGRTAASQHLFNLDFGDDGGGLTFAIEYDDGETRLRSRPRTVVFRSGAYFTQREYTVYVGQGLYQEWPMQIGGVNPRPLGSEAFLSGGFPEGVRLYVNPLDGTEDGGRVMLGLVDDKSVPEGGTRGWLEVHDHIHGTYDRVMLYLKR
jgi:hypothetical protein